jgi:hypothetical protein
LPLDPDPDSQYGSGSTKSLNPDPIRIHNPAFDGQKCLFKIGKKSVFIPVVNFKKIPVIILAKIF